MSKYFLTEEKLNMWDTSFVFNSIIIAFLKFYSIVSGVINYAYSIKTTFANQMGAWLPKKHSLHLPQCIPWILNNSQAQVVELVLCHSPVKSLQLYLGATLVKRSVVEGQMKTFSRKGPHSVWERCHLPGRGKNCEGTGRRQGQDGGS